MTNDSIKLLDRLGRKGKFLKVFLPMWCIFGSMIIFSLLVIFKTDIIFALAIAFGNFVLSVIIMLFISWVLAWWYQDFPWEHEKDSI